ncbi:MULTISPECIES: oligosaccharide flippase family protein [unclassified Sinorhizobium]|uniref:oligosaccharide flippase family protein n=1 Tax=unclassified Sinorhizobium TaxID=2613772 RepID=UPI003523F75A
MLTLATLKGAIWLVLSRFVSRIIDLVTLLILAQLLTPADFGTAALGTAFVVVVDTVLEVPIAQALVRLKSIDRSHLDTGFTLSVIRSVVMALVVLVAAWPYSAINNDPTLVPLVAVLALGPLARGFASPAMVHFARQLSFRQTFLMETVGKACACASATVTVLLGGGYWAIAANFVAASVAASLLSYAIAPYRPSLTLSRLADFAGFIGWFSLAQLISALNWQSDRFLIGAAADKATLGRYAVASDLAVLPTQTIIGPALQPVMAAFALISSDPERVRLAFLKAVRFAMLVSVPVALGISLTADLATDLLLGPQWKDAAPFLSLLALVVIPIPYFQTVYSVSLALDRPDMIFRLNAIDLCIRVVLISVGFYLYAAEGLAIAKIVLSCIMFAWYLAKAKELLGLGILVQLRNIWKVALAAAAMAIVVVVLRRAIFAWGWNDIGELALVATTGAAVYVAVLFALGLKLVIGHGRLELADDR